MLSIGKLGAGQAGYYLDQAEGRVDVVGSVGDGIEEYYGGKPPGIRKGEHWNRWYLIKGGPHARDSAPLLPPALLAFG